MFRVFARFSIFWVSCCVLVFVMFRGFVMCFFCCGSVSLFLAPHSMVFGCVFVVLVFAVFCGFVM